MNDMLQLREATRDDLPAIAAIFEAAGVDAPGVNTPQRMQAAWERLHRAVPDVQVLLAEEGGRPLGTLTFYPLPTLGHGGSPAALVEAVAVHPQAQGRGIGRALMDEAMARARAAGCYKLALSSNRKRDGAHAFYERLGYERHGISFVACPQEAAP
ncbi:GNAT family N-acetyltransferase [Piscinibacter sp. XHJ-5]|uniref:GNAT family N-acetyltransferase n=1 Tax=Piscinibacter sp. XHJ-5 TaxID=3037797 RepID=UPI00245335DB|nr:GNAT family N-acetyltransferase [Piscinibacter sp. XHJ-5]